MDTPRVPVDTPEADVMWSIPNTVCVIGFGAYGPHAVLHKVLTAPECVGPIVVVDAVGRGAAVLGDELGALLEQRSMTWLDLADRRRPITLFRLGAGDHVKDTMLWVLERLKQIAELAKLSNKTLSWAVDVWFRLTAEGDVGLGALLQRLSEADTRRWFQAQWTDATELDRLVSVLKWCLRFPAVYALSEAAVCSPIFTAHHGSVYKGSVYKGSVHKAGREEADIDSQRNRVIWLEARLESFEAAEHELVQTLLFASVAESVRSLLSSNAPNRTSVSTAGGDPVRCTVIYLYPTVFPVERIPVPVHALSSSEAVEAATAVTAVRYRLPGWVSATSDQIRHVMLVRGGSRVSIPPAALPWVEGADELWVLQPPRPLLASAHRHWASDGVIKRINALRPGQVWIRDRRTGKALATRLGPTRRSPMQINRVHGFRFAGSQKRPAARFRQVSRLVDRLVPPQAKHGDLFERLQDRELLRLGWFRANRGVKKTSHGIDNVTIGAFRSELEKELDALSGELRSGRYRCRPLRRVYIPKAGGGRRPLGIACVRDRVVQAACLVLLEPIFEPEFSHYSFAFRPRRNAHQAIHVARSMIASGRTWAVTADIRKCFDSIDHDVLMGLVEQRVHDQALLKLIRHWLTIEVLDFHDLLPTEVGVPQGEPLSPMLANIYLDPLDKHFERLGLDFVRYADDIVLLATGEEGAKAALDTLAGFLHSPLRMQLKPAKTQYAPVQEGIDFLGFRMTGETITIRPSRLDRALDKMRPLVRELGSPQATFMQRAEALGRVSALTRGFRNYFSLDGEATIDEQLTALDGRVEQMAHAMLPSTLRDDPAWVGRDRFGSSLQDEQTGGAIVSPAFRETASGGYPEDEPDPLPGSWMTKTARDRLAGAGAGAGAADATADAETDEEGGDPGLIFDDGRLFVLQHGSYVMADGEDLVVRKRKTEIARLPLNELVLIYLQGLGMNISVPLQIELAERDVPVVFAPPVGHPVAMLTPIHSHRAFLRSQQVLRRSDPDILQAGLAMIAAKTSNQAAVLRYFGKYRRRGDPDLGRALDEAARSIREQADRISGLDPARENLRSIAMGYEGQAAATYWQQLVILLPQRHGFEGRVQQTTVDPVNQCINYVYGILYGEVWRSIVSVGLDPYFGLMHGSQRDQGSLVFDLIEEFRAPFADRAVLAMIGRGFVPIIGKQGQLRTRARRQLATAFLKRWHKPLVWRSKRRSPARILAHQASSLVKLTERKGDYHPYRMRW